MAIRERAVWIRFSAGLEADERSTQERLLLTFGRSGPKVSRRKGETHSKNEGLCMSRSAEVSLTLVSLSSASRVQLSENIRAFLFPKINWSSRQSGLPCFFRSAARSAHTTLRNEKSLRGEAWFFLGANKRKMLSLKHQPCQTSRKSEK